MHTSVEIWAVKNGISITEKQLDLLAQHQAHVLQTNQHINLTAITDPHEFAVKHIIDSLTLLPYISHLPPGTHLADVGSGAGFPGMVLAIMRQDLHVTLIDSLRKRVNFLQETVSALGLTNVKCIHTRAEDLKRSDVAFDVCTVRAVAAMDKLAKWVLPITKPDGLFLAMKGPDVSDELDRARPVLDKFGGVVEKVDVVEIAPGLRHSVVVINKTTPPN